MTLENFFLRIETLDFEAELAIASGLVLFQIILDNNQVIQRLIQELRRSSENRDAMLAHLFDLLEVEAEPGFVHSHDLFIAAYLYVLEKVDAMLAFKTAKQVLQTGQLRSARRMARRIVEAVHEC